MSQGFFYCSELSRQRGEPKYGTASVGEVWLLIEYPFWWGAQAFHDSALTSEVKAHLTAALTSIPRARLLFIKQDPLRRRPIKFFVVRSRPREPFIVEFTLDAYDELLQIEIAAAASGHVNSAGVRRTEPLFLVCTHGRRDKCCAKFGYAIYKNLRAGGETDVWQTSHVGGDRFAANLICFPHGLFYAHVTDTDAQTILMAYRERRLVLNKFRGRACYPHAVQAAEYFIRAEANLDGFDELRLLERKRIAETSWRIRFAAPADRNIYDVTVSSRISAFHQFLTCDAAQEKSVEQFSLDDYRVAHDRAHKQA